LSSTPSNIFADVAPPATGERFETLLAHRNLVIERIVSSATLVPLRQAQTQDEWVVLLSGEASLEVNGQRVRLASGDTLFLPAGTPHTVERASEGALWLAVHLHPDGASQASQSAAMPAALAMRT
jgi:cupin 2 domain-containing protein